MGVDPVRPDTGPSLVGEWSRGLLANPNLDTTAIAASAHPLVSLPRNMVGPDPLAGTTRDGIGPAVWAFLSHLAIAGTNHSPLPHPDDYRLSSTGDWRRVGQALEHLDRIADDPPHVPMAWHLVRHLQRPMASAGQARAWRENGLADGGRGAG